MKSASVLLRILDTMQPGDDATAHFDDDTEAIVHMAGYGAFRADTADGKHHPATRKGMAEWLEKKGTESLVVKMPGFMEDDDI